MDQEKQAKGIMLQDAESFYASLIANHGFREAGGFKAIDLKLKGIMKENGLIYVIRISDNDFLEDKISEYADFTSIFDKINQAIKWNSESVIIQLNDVFFDIMQIRNFYSIDGIPRTGKFMMAESDAKLPIIYKFDQYYAYFATYDPEKMDDGLESGKYFIQITTIKEKKKSFRIKVYSEIKTSIQARPHSDIIPGRFASIASLGDWREYLLANHPDVFHVDDWITKSVAFLLVDFCERDKLTMLMPSITLNKFVERMTIDDSTKITLKLFEVITQLKDSRIVSRSGRKETSKSYIHVEMNYLNLMETTITLLPLALKEILGLPDQFLEVAEEYQEYRKTPVSERQEKQLGELGIPKPSLGRVIEPTYDLDDCILSPSVKQEIEGFINSIERRERLLLWGVDYVPKLLLAGVIGTGKTITAQAIAKRLGMLLFRISGEDIVGPYLGESAQNVLKAFDFAAKYKSRVILFIDELDSIVSKRGFDQAADKDVGRAVNTFITLMEERNEIIIAATNHAHAIDASCLSRFTKLIFYELPDDPMMERLLEIHLKDIPLDEGISVIDIAPRLVMHHFSGRDVRNLVVEIVQEMLVANADILTTDILEHCLERTIERAEKFMKSSKDYKELLNNS